MIAAADQQTNQAGQGPDAQSGGERGLMVYGVVRADQALPALEGVDRAPIISRPRR